MDSDPTAPPPAAPARPIETASPGHRRQFLKAVAASLAGAAAVTDLPWLSPLRAEPVGAAPSDRVRLGLIGAGSRGGLLMDHLLQTPGVAVAGVCDVYPPHLERAIAATSGKAKGYADYRALLDAPDIDAVVIATPLDLHAPMCLAAFSAGKGVFCEKSLARTIDDCKAVARAASASPHVFQVGHQRLFDLRFLTALDHMRAGALGPITQIRAYWHRNLSWRRPAPADLDRLINWRLYRDRSAGLMGELGSHHLHVVNWILEGPPLACVGYGSVNYWKDGREIYDNVNLIYRYANGVSLVYDSLSSNQFHGMEVQVMGPKGTMELETGRMYWEPSATPPPAAGVEALKRQLETGQRGPVRLAAPTWRPELKSDLKGAPILAGWDGGDGTALSLAAFANAVRLGQKTPSMIDHAYRSGVAALIGLQAMEEGREVAWPGDYAT